MSQRQGDTRLTSSTVSADIVYDRTAQLMFTFFEWRYNILTRYAISIGALAFAVKWCYEAKIRLPISLLPFLAGVVISILAIMMDRIHTNNIEIAYDCGIQLESISIDLKSTSYPGMFSAMRAKTPLPDASWKDRAKKNSLRYRIVVKIAYFCGVAGWMLAGILYSLYSGR